MSRKSVKIVLFLAGALVVFSGMALAKKSRSIHIVSDSVLPSGQALKAGQYQVDLNEASMQVTFTIDDKVVATAAYKAVDKPAKNVGSQARFGLKDSKRELQELRFDGETRTIVIGGGES